MLEYAVGSAAVAVGAGGFINAILDQAFGYSLPDSVSAPPGEGGTVNLPAVALVAIVTVLLYRGVRITAKANIVLVVVTVLVLLLVIVVGGTQVDTGNWDPYFPFGFSGIVGGAALVFFAFIGFDVVATTAEEARDPQRDMAWGIVGSLALVTIFYVAVAAVVTGMLPYRKLTGDAPVADAFDATLDSPVLTTSIFVGALVALSNTVMVLLLGQIRVAFAMARDHLLPRTVARTHDRFGTPHRITLITGAAVAIVAGLVPLSTLAELVNIGTLFAFALVAAGDRLPASGRSRARAPLPHPRGAPGPDPRRRRLPLPGDRPPRGHLDPLRGLDGHRPGGLLPLGPAKGHSRCLIAGPQTATRHPGAPRRWVGGDAEPDGGKRRLRGH